MVAVVVVVSKGAVVVVRRGRTMKKLLGSPDFCSLPHHCRMGFSDAVDCLCWEYDGCGRDEQESILGGFRKT